MEIKPATSLLNPFSVELDLAEAVMRAPENRIARKASDMRGY